MKAKDTPRRTEARSLCADLHPDDVRSTLIHHERREGDCDERKTMQLCAQVRRALHGVMPPPDHATLEGLIVEAVEPDPDASRLRIVVSMPASCAMRRAEIEHALRALNGVMRSEVARQIHRKRVPLLAVELIPRREEP